MKLESAWASHIISQLRQPSLNFKKNIIDAVSAQAQKSKIQRASREASVISVRVGARGTFHAKLAGGIGGGRALSKRCVCWGFAILGFSYSPIWDELRSGIKVIPYLKNCFRYPSDKAHPGLYEVSVRMGISHHFAADTANSEFSELAHWCSFCLSTNR